MYAKERTSASAVPMTVSIIIPTFNRGYIIGEAIASALTQTYRDFEIIIVDDGSSDNTRDIVESIGSNQIRYLHHERNRGYSAACNTGISAATGELLAFLDSDDLWKPDYLERQVGFLTKHSETGVVFCDTELRDESGVISSLIKLLRIFPRMLQPKSAEVEYIFPFPSNVFVSVGRGSDKTNGGRAETCAV